MKIRKCLAKQNVNWSKRMNNIVEINYPNLESYFKELLLKQEFSRKCYWSAIKENLSEALAFLGIILFLGFVISVFKIPVDAETLPTELKVIPWNLLCILCLFSYSDDFNRSPCRKFRNFILQRRDKKGK